MPKRTLHIQVEDDGDTMDFRTAVIVSVGGIGVPVVVGQFDQLSLPKESIEQWQKDVLVALLEEL